MGLGLRWLLADIGVVFIALGIASWVWAPKHTKFAPAATSKDATAKVSDPSETLSTALIAAGVLLLLVGANGRKIVSIKVGGDELSFAEAVSKAAAAKAKKKAAAENLSPAQLETAEAIAAGDAFSKAISDPYEADTEAIAQAAVSQAKEP
jgi:hypothetical protein